MKKEIHKIFDKILKLILIEYADEFLLYIGVDKAMKKILHTEITTKKGRTLYLDFLCELKDGTLLNIEFQITGPDGYDLDRFHDYNIHTQTLYDTICETIVISFKTSKSGQKTRRIGKTKSIHPIFIYLGDIDFEKILNTIENKAKNNIKLTNMDELSLMLMCLLPKYKNKKEILERIINLHKKEELFDKRKINTFKAVLKLEIENFVNDEERKKLKGELKMTPEAEEMITRAFYEVEMKHHQLELEEIRRDAQNESKIEIAKKLKAYHTPKEIAKITGLTLKTIKDL